MKLFSKSFEKRHIPETKPTPGNACHCLPAGRFQTVLKTLPDHDTMPPTVLLKPAGRGSGKIGQGKYRPKHPWLFAVAAVPVLACVARYAAAPARPDGAAARDGGH
ncbi:hypothetical protein, partial [Novacetimonas pomaceti]|uniref:hypothetical protein n=1 Tax=Novacetimonas pomaceti TaxID=2021998 RepID=UPI001C2D7B80